jgi:Tol biopolymer transport system component
MALALTRSAIVLIGTFFVVGTAVVRGWNVPVAVVDQYLIYASRADSQTASLYMTAVDRNEHHLLDPNFDARSGFACSGNGEHFAFMNNGQLHIISADGRQEVMNILRGRRVHSLTISNDGAAAVLSVYSMSNLSIGILHIPDDKVRWLSNGLNSTAPHLSYDDSTILFNVAHNPGESAREVYTMGVDASNMRRLLTRASDAVWMPDDQTLAYVGRNRDLYITDLHRMLSVSVTRNASGSYVFYPAWSPDGGRLAYLAVRDNASELRLYVADANGKNARQLAVTGQVIDRGPCFLSFRPETLLASALS